MKKASKFKAFFIITIILPLFEIKKTETVASTLRIKFMNRLSFFLIPFALYLISCGDPIETAPIKNTTQELTNPSLDSLNHLILNDVNNIDLYLKRSDLYFSNNQYDAAFKDLRKAKRIDSTNANIYLRAGKIMYNNQSFAEAKQNFETCLEYDGNQKYCRLENAKMELLLENYSNALMEINKALKVDKYFSEAYFLKGRYYELKGDTTNAVSSYSTAIENDPNYFDAFLQIAVLYTAINSDLAIEYYNSALEIKPKSVEALQNLGLFYQNSGQFEKAIANYNKAELIMPDNAIVNYNKGYIYLVFKNEMDSAIHEFSQATYKFPNYYQAYYNLGLAFERKGNLHKALNNFDNSLKIKPDYTPAAISKGRVAKTLTP